MAKKSKSVPSGRVSRFGKMAKLATTVAGGMLAEGARQISAGNRPAAKDMLLTPANAKRVANQLADMRGAAMKVGQLLSMDTGNLLPRELADILARLRSEGESMPFKQLETQLISAYGGDWEHLLFGFDDEPLATASIGQVHRCHAPDGREIVLKIQYPGIAESIDSDVDNMASLLGLSGVIPKGIDLKPLLTEAKAQLHVEADYLREAEQLAAFGNALADDDRFVVPSVVKDLCRPHILAMTYEPAEPIESIEAAPQEERYRVCSALIELMFNELFGMRLVQTDPNFANYQYRSSTGEIVLLDFGAVRAYSKTFVTDYKALAKAACERDRDGLLSAAIKIGYLAETANPAFKELLTDAFLLATEPMQKNEPYDFGRSNLPERLTEFGLDMMNSRDAFHTPPADAIFFHRKLGGMFMLAARLKASVNVRALIEPWL